MANSRDEYKSAHRQARIEKAKKEAKMDRVWAERKLSVRSFEPLVQRIITSWVSFYKQQSSFFCKYRENSVSDFEEFNRVLDSIYIHYDKVSSIPFYSSYSSVFTLPNQKFLIENMRELREAGDCDGQTDVLFVRATDIWFHFEANEINPDGFYIGNFVEAGLSLSLRDSTTRIPHIKIPNSEKLLYEAMLGYEPILFLSFPDFSRSMKCIQNF